MLEERRDEGIGGSSARGGSVQGKITGHSERDCGEDEYLGLCREEV
jgi:hypothetical protein